MRHFHRQTWQRAARGGRRRDHSPVRTAPDDFCSGGHICWLEAAARRWRRKRAGKRRDATATTLWCGRRGLFPIISRLWNVHDAPGASMTPHVSSAGILSVKIGPFVRRDALQTENRRPPRVRNRSPAGWSANSPTFNYFSGVWTLEKKHWI